jgi:hypothetical protein
MNFYQLQNGEVAGFDNPAQAPDGAVAITAEQFAQVATTVLTVEQAQSSQIAALTSAYQAAIQQPVAFTSKGGISQTFQADAPSQTVLMQAVQGYMIAGATPDGFFWKAADNTHVPFVLADLQGLYEVMLARGWAAFQKLQVLKTSVSAATTTAAALAVVWS